jgi:hypothetical protein
MGLGGGPGGLGKGAPAEKAEAASPKSRPDQNWLRRIFDPSTLR